MGYALKDALRTAIRIEKNSFDFYQRAASIVDDERTREVFNFLAGEEAEHMEAFLGMYPGDEFGDLIHLMDQPPDFDNPAYRELINTVDAHMSEEEALQMSLREERACVLLYAGIVEEINDRKAREVFEHALKNTRMHCEVIDEEFYRVMRKAARRETSPHD